MIADLATMTAKTETTADLDLMTAMTETTAALDLMSEDPTKTAETTITVNEMDRVPTTAINDMSIMLEEENAGSRLKGSKHCLISHSMLNLR